MPDVITTLFDFVLPEVGASDNTWGTKLNSNLSKLETLLVDAFPQGSPTGLSRLAADNAPLMTNNQSFSIQKAGLKQYRFSNTANDQEGQVSLDDDGTMIISVTDRTGGPNDGVQMVRLELGVNGVMELVTGIFHGQFEVASGSTLIDPIIMPAGFPDNGSRAFTIGLERSWSVGQFGTGGGAGLEFKAATEGGKSARFVNLSRNHGLLLDVDNDRIDGVSSPLFLGAIGSGYVQVGNSLHVASNIFGDASYFSDSASTSGYFLRSSAGLERGGLVKDGATTDLLLRRKHSDGRIVSQIRFEDTGAIRFESGVLRSLSFGTLEASSPSDLSKHFDLAGGAYGLSYTPGQQNYIANTGGRHHWRIGGVIAAELIEQTDGLPDAYTIVTRSKGDTRYLNSSNQNTGTLPQDRLPMIPTANLPVSTQARDWVLARMSESSAGALGTTASLQRDQSGAAVVFGNVYTGVQLVYFGSYAAPPGTYVGTIHPAGSWEARCDAPADDGRYGGGTFIRVA